MSESDIESAIIELCSEDDYGSWELWWKVAPEATQKADESLRRSFVLVIENLVERKELVPWKKEGGNFRTTVFDRSKLASEIERSMEPDPEAFYWFGRSP